MTKHLCGYSWCTIQHRSANSRRQHGCASIWKANSAHSNPLAMSLYPSPAFGRDRPDAHVYVTVIGKLQDMWVNKPRGLRGTGAVLHVDDARAMAEQLLEVVRWVEEQTAIILAKAQPLEE